MFSYGFKIYCVIWRLSRTCICIIWAFPLSLSCTAFSLTIAMAAKIRRDSEPVLNHFKNSSSLMQKTSPEMETQVTEVEHLVLSPRTSCSPNTYPIPITVILILWFYVFLASLFSEPLLSLLLSMWKGLKVCYDWFSDCLNFSIPSKLEYTPACTSSSI